jgi:transcriptional regulator with XRE-family HTH domain
MKVVSPTHKKFGDRLKELRDKNKFTQEDLADKVGVDRSYMGFLERGEKNPTLKNLIRIANAFDITLSELFKKI